MWPSKLPQPAAVGAVRSVVAVHAASRRWLSFFLSTTMSSRRFILCSLCAMPVLLGLYVFLASDCGELPDDPTVSLSLVAFIYFGALVLWPFFVHGLAFHQAPHGILWLAMFAVTALFWGFIIEWLFLVKTRLWQR